MNSLFKLQIICITILFATTTINAQNLDSLRHQIDIQTGKNKHNSLAMYYTLTKDTPEGAPYLRKLFATSEKKGDKETQGKILELFIVDHYYLQNGDSVLYYAEEIKKLNAEHSLYFYFNVMKASVNMLIADGRYERALQELDEMLSEATRRKDVLAKAQVYQLMGATYTYMYQPEQAAKYIAEGLQLTNTVKSTDLQLHKLRFDLYNHGAVAASLSKDYEKGLAYTDSMYSQIKKIEEHHRQNNTYSESLMVHNYYNTHIQRLSFLTSLGRYDEAKSVLNDLTAIAYRPEIPSAYNTAVFNYGKAQYLTATGDYNSALAILDDAMDTTRKYFFSQYPSSLLLKAEILEKQKKFHQAIDVYKEICHIQDSLKSTELQKQVADLKSVYQVEELEQEAEERELRMRVAYAYIAAISLTCILLIVIMLIVSRNARQQKKKNKALYNQLKEQDKYKAALRNIAMESNPNAGESNNLYNQISEYLQKTKYYLDEDVSRENLALKMGTNYKYLSDAIKEATGQTFNDYINDLRLEYSRELLTSQPGEDLTDDIR